MGYNPTIPRSDHDGRVCLSSVFHLGFTTRCTTCRWYGKQRLPHPSACVSRVGYFLTDARTRRGTNGSPVVMHSNSDGQLPWQLLGVRSARMDMGGRDLELDETLGLNCAWYADILLTVTR